MNTYRSILAIILFCMNTCRSTRAVMLLFINTYRSTQPVMLYYVNTYRSTLAIILFYMNIDQHGPLHYSVRIQVNMGYHTIVFAYLQTYTARHAVYMNGYRSTLAFILFYMNTYRSTLAIMLFYMNTYRSTRAVILNCYLVSEFQRPISLIGSPEDGFSTSR